MSFITKYQKKIINEGISECNSLKDEQNTEKMKEFYKGSVEGFNNCRGLSQTNLQELIKEVNEEEMDVFNKYASNPSNDLLNKLWYQKGVSTQVRFVYERISLFK